MPRLAALALVAAAAALLPGCLLVAGAAIGAGVVYTTGEDTAEVRVRATVAQAFDVAREEVLKRGKVDSSDSKSGVLEGTIDSSTVRVTVVDDTDGMVKVSVKARKLSGLGPDMDGANRVAVAIVKRIG